MKTAQELRAGNVFMVGSEPMVVKSLSTTNQAVTLPW